MHGSLEDHFLVITIPWLYKVITYLLVPGVKNQTGKQTYDDPICYAGTALTELVFFSSLERPKLFSVQVIEAT